MTYQLYDRIKQSRFRTARTIAAALFAILASGTLAIMDTASANADLPNYTPGSLLVMEMQTGGCKDGVTDPCVEDSKREYIKLVNNSSQNLELKGWSVQYVSASGGTTTPLVTINGTLYQYGVITLTHVGYYGKAGDISFGSDSDSGKLAKSGGHVRIVDAQGVIRENLGWGSAAQPLGKAVKAHEPHQAIQRIRDTMSDNAFTHTSYNANDFQHVTDFNVIDSLYRSYVPTPAADPQPDPTTDPIPDPAPPVVAPLTCEGVTISEIPPNPTGDDGQNEFVELRNPTAETIALDSCLLQTSANSKTYALNGNSLEPDSYHAFSSKDAGLTLNNAAGGTVWLMTADTEVHEVVYATDLDENVSWAQVDGTWVATFTPTSGAANIVTDTEPCPANQERNLETNRCVAMNTDTDASTVAPSSSILTPCKEGQERNPETNRCRAITSASASSLTPCKAGQTRNPDTNRCINPSSTNNDNLTPRKEGQERNPETNRCRNVAGAGSTAAACPAGQERNPETNRCKKITAAAASSTDKKVEDVKSPLNGNNSKWILIGLIIAGVIAYGVFEWRQEIMMKLRRIIDRGPRQQVA